MAALVRLGLPATSQPSPEHGRPAAGWRAVDLAWLPAYLRGGRFAVHALAGRVPEAREQAQAMIAVSHRLIAALGSEAAEQLNVRGRSGTGSGAPIFPSL